MSFEEQVEQIAQQTAQQAAQGVAGAGARVVVRVSGWVAKQLLKGASWPLRKGAQAAKDAIHTKLTTGRMSEKRLQITGGGDLHHLEFNPEKLKDITRELRKAGVNYSIEEHDNGQWFLIFQGKDQDHIQHVVARALGELDLQLTEDQPDLKQEQEQPSTPVQKEPAEPETPEQTDKTEVRTASPEDGQTSREQPKHSEKTKAPGTARPKNKKAFKAELEGRANEKLRIANEKPVPVKTKARGK
ncbi:DUF3801 domain-containing protein [Bifidobacterium miconisargentati]|uniref:DUF3801 domain-containing protein n=1 Tax=Bifidobacterium miconisargentati TaxID=2834437 RepID=UPI001BDD8C2A|nr:DUF3801 domain-containing protein [Bifidobacterium miconisargentati]MBW3089207.1 DUF3801 domain-containing protein [Bifidobacterium miconisargentati]